jgi:hypothetical protein
MQTLPWQKISINPYAIGTNSRILGPFPTRIPAQKLSERSRQQQRGQFMSFAFQARCRGDETAVTIIAHDMEHAGLIFAEWLRNHRRHIISQFMDFRVFTDRHVYAQPEMRGLMEAGYTGVCYWLEEPEV